MGNIAYCPVCGTPSNVTTKRVTMAGELQRDNAATATTAASKTNDEEKKAAMQANETKRYMRRLNRHIYQVNQEPSKFSTLERINSDADLSAMASPSLRLAPPERDDQPGYVIGARTPGVLSGKTPHVRRALDDRT